jgi:hypothetical protein
LVRLCANVENFQLTISCGLQFFFCASARDEIYEISLKLWKQRQTYYAKRIEASKKYKLLFFNSTKSKEWRWRWNSDDKWYKILLYVELWSTIWDGH